MDSSIDRGKQFLEIGRRNEIYSVRRIVTGDFLQQLDGRQTAHFDKFPVHVDLMIITVFKDDMGQIAPCHQLRCKVSLKRDMRRTSPSVTPNAP